MLERIVSQEIFGENERIERLPYSGRDRIVSVAPDCIFCQIVAKTIPADILYENEHTLAFADIRPVAPAHILVIPKTHVGSVHETDDAQLLGELLRAGNAVARQQGLSDSGFRFVMNTGDDGGQTVYHLHLHVLGGRALQWPPG